jgi:exopolysaccharide biosynthesis polyprenyl glycosylphosphotransferase
MDQRFSRLSILLFIGDMLLTPIGLLTASWLRVILPYGKELGAGGEILPIAVYVLAVVCWSGALMVSGAYNFDRPRTLVSRVTQVISAAGMATILLAGLLYMTYREISRLQFVYTFFLTLALLLTFRVVVLILARLRSDRALLSPNRVLFIGAGALGQEVVRTIRKYQTSTYKIVGYLDDNPALQDTTVEALPVLGSLDDLLDVIQEHQVMEVWSTLPPRAYDRLHALVSKLESIPVRIKVIPDYFSLALVQANVEMLGSFPLIGLRDPVIRGFPRWMKRIFDLVIGSMLFVLSAPLMIFIAIAIRLDSAGPILFRQERVGENAKPFQMLKFRTMVPDADIKLKNALKNSSGNDVIHKRIGDPRVTRVGHILRRLSLDELPQLFNVLRGEMSLVGPRPELPWLVERYKPWQRKRFAVPQGITGWWQINGRSEKPMHLNTDEDLYYIYNYSLWLDIKILVKTPIAVLLGRGAF